MYTVSVKLEVGEDIPKLILLHRAMSNKINIGSLISLHIHHNPEFPDSELNLGPSCCEVTAPATTLPGLNQLNAQKEAQTQYIFSGSNVSTADNDTWNRCHIGRCSAQEGLCDWIQDIYTHHIVVLPLQEVSVCT